MSHSVSVHEFAMVPSQDVPRSSLPLDHTLKATFDAGFLVPIFLEDMLPGDMFKVNGSYFARLATPITPFFDNLWFDVHWFFCPKRLLWSNWVKMQGEQANPGDSTSYTIPQMVCPAGGYAINSIFDHMGLMTVGQMGAGATASHSALPLRMYNRVYNEWFRDQNLTPALVMNTGDGPDNYLDYSLARRGKRHDYFTACLPFLQKGPAVPMPVGTSAPIVSTGIGIAFDNQTFTRAGTGINLTTGSAVPTWSNSNAAATSIATFGPANQTIASMQVNLAAATGNTVNLVRQSIAVQQMYELDARGGTRYSEAVSARFGVQPQDFRLNRPEFIGSSSDRLSINPVAQTSATGVTGATTPQANLSAIGYVSGESDVTYSAMEHGYIMAVASVRADLTYQQGVRRHWFKTTRQDFYEPIFAHLGEQAVYNREIYCDGSVNDAAVFGYQERWAEYRYKPSEIHGLFRSTAAGTLDVWHLSQKFTALPTLNNTFILDQPPVARITAVASGALNQQFLLDAGFTGTMTRPLPTYSVPGLLRF